jgi:hypothetical protein
MTVAPISWSELRHRYVRTISLSGLVVWVACGNPSPQPGGTNMGGAASTIAGSAGASGSAGTAGAAVNAGSGGDAATGGQGVVDGGLTATDFRSRIALGGEYGCAIQGDGAVICWGTATGGNAQTTPPAAQFTSIAALLDITCGITNRMTVECWGNLSGAVAQDIPAMLSATAIGVGVSEQCVVTSQGAKLACWGAPGVIAGQVPAGPYLQVGVGRNFACVLKSDQTLACWGNDAFGEATPPPGKFVQLVTGEFHSCALGDDGSALCWGLGNATMQVGAADASAEDEVPYGEAIAPTDQKFERLAVGVSHSCGILDSGDIECWGAGKTAGDCSSIDTCGQSVSQVGPFVDLALGLSNSCGILASGKLKCWGSNTGGRSTPPASFQY